MVKHNERAAFACNSLGNAATPHMVFRETYVQSFH